MRRRIRSTWSGGRGHAERLSDGEAKAAPPANGRWDTAHKRLLGAEGGDIFIHDPAAPGARVAVTRTSAPESSPRWARNGTHVTYGRDGNLFIVPVQPGAAALVTELTDVGPRRAEPRLTDSQKFLREEEEKLIGFMREKREDKQKAEEKAKAVKLPAFELQDRQTAVDLMLSPDDTHVFILVAERPAGAKNTIVPNYVTESGYTEDIPGRTNVGDTQDLPRQGRHQRALPGLGASRAAIDRAAQGELGAGRLPGREPRVHGGDQLGRRIPAHPEAVRG